MGYTLSIQEVRFLIFFLLLLLGFIAEGIRNFKDISGAIKYMTNWWKKRELKKKIVINETLLVRNFHTIQKIIDRKAYSTAFHYQPVIKINNDYCDDLEDLKCLWKIKRNKKVLANNLNKEESLFNIAINGFWYYHSPISAKHLKWRNIESGNEYKIEISIFWKGIRIKKHEIFDLMIINSYEDYEKSFVGNL